LRSIAINAHYILHLFKRHSDTTISIWKAYACWRIFDSHQPKRRLNPESMPL